MPLCTTNYFPILRLERADCGAVDIVPKKINYIIGLQFNIKSIK
jgi:hypothetical protein